MPHELDRIKELAGLQQEAEPQNTADGLISTITKLAQDALEKSNFSNLRLFQDKEREIQELIKQKAPNADVLAKMRDQYPTMYNLKDFPSKADYEDMLAYLMKQMISIGREHLKLPPYNFDKFKKTAKPTNLTGPQQQALAALVKKYANRKTYGGGGLIDGYLDYLAQTGIWTDAADEKEFDVALKKLGHKNLAAWEKRAQGEEFEQFLELAPITAQAQNDVAKVLGKGFENNEELISAASDYVRSLPESVVQEAPATESLPAPSSDEEHAEMLFKTHPEYSKKYKTVQNFMRSQDFRDHMDHLSYKAQEASAISINNSTMPTELNRIKELAGLQQEAPAVGLTAQQKQGLDAINAKYGKYIGYGNGGSLPVEAMERAIDPGSTLWADDKEENELKAYMKKMGYKDLSDMESKDEEYVDNVRLPISDAMADDLQKVLGDYNDNSGLAQAAKDYLGSLGETAVQSTPVNSSVDDTIQRARAQIETLESALKEDYKKFQGMKPYKPKKK